MTRRWVTLFAVVLLVVTISVAGVAQQESIEELRARAEAGDAQAQFNLGLRYDNAQDYAEALRWYRLGAEQGQFAAMRNLGLMYAEGRGVPQDDVQAHMWINLAASRLSAAAARRGIRDGIVKLRDGVENRMTPAQITEAQRLAREWDEAHPRD